MLDNLAKARDGRSKRVSSWDVTGGNRDCWTVEPGETKVLADISGAGVIRHIWFTVACQDELYLRKTVLRMYWDGMDRPSVECCLGDFFGVGHAVCNSFDSAVLNMSSAHPQRAAMNCYFPMPFADGARVTVENECEVPIRSFYFYFDYDELKSLPDDMLRFHAHWRRSNPCRPPRQKQKPNVNLSDSDNYLILDARGRGHYVGCNLSVHNLGGGWWGEGDDMIMVDGQKWPPDLHGTGSEDYFSHAWGMQPKNNFIYNGVSYHKPGTHHAINERITVYRYHVCDPVVFTKSLRVSIEHGHANDRNDDYSSVAYWYQTLPHKKFPPFPRVTDRLPRADIEVIPTPKLDRPRASGGGVFYRTSKGRG